MRLPTNPSLASVWIFWGARVGLGMVFGVLFGLGSFGTPWEALGVTLGHLGVTLGPLGLLGTAPGCFWDPMLPDLAVFLTLWAQKFGQDANKYDF